MNTESLLQDAGHNPIRALAEWRKMTAAYLVLTDEMLTVRKELLHLAAVYLSAKLVDRRETSFPS